MYAYSVIENSNDNIGISKKCYTWSIAIFVDFYKMK